MSETVTTTPDQPVAQPLTAEDVHALRERFQEASPGQWFVVQAQDEWAIEHEHENVLFRTHSARPHAAANARFVALAHNALPALLATVEAQAARIAELERGGKSGGSGGSGGKGT